ncbi:MAG: hypothetical protein MR380_10900 [Lachnospiraceae bacterium]|nr:hypothetical protein [Lachnospiraceae bacterium]
MKKVYMVYHEIKMSRGICNYKLIGFYSTKEKAKKIVKKYRTFEGFKDFPKEFHIKTVSIDKLPKKLKRKKCV